MNGVIIKKQTTVKGALSGNKVLMVGRILNKRQMAELIAAMKKREAEVIENRFATTAVKPVVINADEERVEIAKFFVKYQEEREMAKAMQKRRANKKKAPVKKPSFLENIVNKLASL